MIKGLKLLSHLHVNITHGDIERITREAGDTPELNTLANVISALRSDVITLMSRLETTEERRQQWKTKAEERQEIIDGVVKQLQFVIDTHSYRPTIDID